MFGIARQSWGVAFGAARRMPLLFGSAALLLVLLSLGNGAVLSLLGIPYLGVHSDPHAVFARLPAQSLVAAVFAVIRPLFVAPWAIGVHRLALLGEAADGVSVARTPRQLRFAAWAAGVSLLFTIPAVLQAFLLPVDAAAGALVPLALLVVSAIVAVRLTLVFPGLALEAPEAAREGRALTQGHGWRIVGAALLTMVPLFVLAGVLLYGLAHGDPASPAGEIVNAIGGAFGAALLAAMASLFYRDYAPSVRGA